MAEYISQEKTITAKPRSKRLQQTGKSVSTGATVITGGTNAVTVTDPNSHTHANKNDLDKLSLKDGYVEITDKKIADDGSETATTNKAKAGTADNLTEDSTDWNKIARKDVEQTIAEKYKFVKGAEFGDFVKDATGGAISVDENGNSTAEFDFLNIRKTAFFRSITVSELKHIGGELAITPAAMVCSNVVEQEDSYRCYFETTDGKRHIYQEFVVGDGARCQQFKFDKTSNGYLRTRYYWRKVVAVGDNYIDLSKSECDTSTDNSVPLENDNIVHLGYFGTDTVNYYRRSAIILSAVAADSPSQKMYQGINSFSLDGCLVKDEGYSNGVFHTNIYGNFYAGTKDKSSYLKFDTDDGVKIKGTLAEGTTTADGTDINNLHTGVYNQIRNSGFTGDYQALELDINTALQQSTELYSNKLVCWDNSNASVNTDNDSVSSYSCTLQGGYISQSLYYKQISGEHYIVIMKAKGTSVTIEVGGHTFTQQLTADYAIYTYKYTSSGGNIFRIAGTCTVTEIELAIGTVGITWAQSPLDNHKMFDRFQAIRYITDAISDGSVQMSGGLALMTMLMLGNYKDGALQKVTSGMSGIYNNDDDVAFWAGGDFESAIKAVTTYKQNPAYNPTETELKAMANAVITHGGRLIMNDAIVRGYIYAVGGTFRGTVRSNAFYSDWKDVMSVSWDAYYRHAWNVISDGCNLSGGYVLNGHNYYLTLPSASAFAGLEITVFYDPSSASLETWFPYLLCLEDTFLYNVSAANKCRVVYPIYGFVKFMSIKIGDNYKWSVIASESGIVYCAPYCWLNGSTKYFTLSDSPSANDKVYDSYGINAIGTVYSFSDGSLTISVSSTSLVCTRSSDNDIINNVKQ